MEKKPPGPSKEQVAEGLKKLRASRPQFANYSVFFERSKIHRGTVEATEDGKTSPGIEIIARWCEACGVSVSEFFADLEGRPMPTPPGIEIEKGRDGLYRMLTTILKSKNERRIHGITVNLEDISSAAEREMAELAGREVKRGKQRAS